MDRNQLLTNPTVFPQPPRATQKDNPWILAEQLAAGILCCPPRSVLLTQSVLDSLGFLHFGSMCPPPQTLAPSTPESLQHYINISKIKPLNFPLVRQYQCYHFPGRGEKADRRDDSLCGLRHVPRQSQRILLCTAQS